MNPKRILVVDDEPLNLKIIRATLEGSEYQLDLAEHGGSAYDPNGRGIAMARQMSFSSLAYQGRGNVVVVRIVRA